ncbi:MAG TPA: hypothetical protein VK927_10725, partial [Adhaeribacter sp.]|nr:hypothetical protein [Adhaeribacter sp.]
MRSSLRQQLAYSFFWLFFLAIAVGGLVAWQSPEKVAELSRIEYFEAERPQTFPVRELSAGFFFWWRLALPVVLLVFAFLSLTFFRTYFTGLPSVFFQALRKVRVCWRQELSSLSTLQKLAAGSILALLIAQRAVYLFRYPI